MTESRIQVPLRLDRELHDRVRRAASQRDRSMNNFITMVLRDWLAAHREGDEPG